jgi:murein DD-endopeptidase MepM/ murein hydrolase activator NlpD
MQLTDVYLKLLIYNLFILCYNEEGIFNSKEIEPLQQPLLKEYRMGKKREKASNKHVYKKPNTKYYVKGSPKTGGLSDSASKVIATALYPFYFAGEKINGLIKSAKSNVQIGSHKANNTRLNIDHTRFEPIKSAAIKYKFQIAGVAAVLAVSVIGFTALNALEPKAEIAAETKQHVVSIPKTATAVEPESTLKAAGDTTETDLTGETAAASEAATTVATTTVELPEFKVMSLASVKTHQLIVNDQVVANFKTEEEANQVLDQLKAKFSAGEATKVKDIYFSEDVKIELGHVDIMNFTAYDTVEATLDFIVKGTKEEKKHVVAKGENYWVIAQYYGISPSDLEKANPDIKAETIQIGQEISLVVPTPIISVVTVEEASYTDAIAFEVQYEESDSLYKGESKTKVNGVYGERAVVAEVIKENGREIGRKILSENVVSEPQSKVVYKGTKNPPPKMGSGSLNYPGSRGVITSEFGVWRSYRRHTGIDIGLNVGSSVKAADGGVVTYSGYSSSYGRYIIVDHGSNMTTLYAHNSSLLVSKGEKVFKGQLIAYSGNTGNSTGPHLHFEVRINGVPKNPRNYVNF